MKIDILTLFPDMFAPLEHSIVGKAKDKGLLEINYHNFRENAEKARHVDDEPYGGGQGMLLRAQPIFDTFDKLNVTKPRVILLDPAGRTFDQAYAEELAQEEELVFICGHYEGYDERIKTLVTDEISLGDFSLIDPGEELAQEEELVFDQVTDRFPWETIIPLVTAKRRCHCSTKVILFRFPLIRPMRRIGLVFICGHYEGYDERIKTLVTDEISLGDFVLTGGELAAMTIVDATVRLIPEVLGKEASHKDDSFSSGLLEFPQYTRPAEFRGMKVPDVLLSGHHVNIRRWRMEQSLRKTWERRPDLLENYDFTDEERQILEEIKAEGK